MTATTYLESCLKSRLSADQFRWLEGVSAASTRSYLLALAQCPRKLGKADLALSAEELARAFAAVPGWNPANWSVDQAARAWLLCRAPGAGFAALFRRLIQTGDMREHMAYFSSLAVLPHADELVNDAINGLRTNIPAVFCAIAQDSPFPAAHFSDHAWNQMILKAVFIGERLDSIVGLDRRANPALALMLHDYVRERQAAGRAVPLEVWRCVIPHLDQAHWQGLLETWRAATGQERRAMALGLAARKDELADAIQAEWQPIAEMSSWAQLVQDVTT